MDTARVRKGYCDRPKAGDQRRPPLPVAIMAHLADSPGAHRARAERSAGFFIPDAQRPGPADLNPTVDAANAALCERRRLTGAQPVTTRMLILVGYGLGESRSAFNLSQQPCGECALADAQIDTTCRELAYRHLLTLWRVIALTARVQQTIRGAGPLAPAATPKMRGRSSVGRARSFQVRCRRFEPGRPPQLSPLGSLVPGLRRLTQQCEGGIFYSEVTHD